MKRDARTYRGRPAVPLGDVRLRRVAALRQAPPTRRRSSDRYRHHRYPGADPTADATATHRQKSQVPSTWMMHHRPGPDRSLVPANPGLNRAKPEAHRRCGERWSHGGLVGSDGPRSQGPGRPGGTLARTGPGGCRNAHHGHVGGYPCSSGRHASDHHRARGTHGSDGDAGRELSHRHLARAVQRRRLGHHRLYGDVEPGDPYLLDHEGQNLHGSRTDRRHDLHHLGQGPQRQGLGCSVQNGLGEAGCAICPNRREGACRLRRRGGELEGSH